MTHFEEAKLVRSVWGTNDQGSNGSDVAISASDGERFMFMTSISRELGEEVQADAQRSEPFWISHSSCESVSDRSLARGSKEQV